MTKGFIVKRNCHNADLPSSAADGPDRREGRCAGRGAFTLVELLTIIVILGMLITLTAPSVMEAIRLFRVDESRTYLQQIGMGIRLYKNDWKDLAPVTGWAPGFPDHLKGLPPSCGGKDGVTGGLRGAYALVQALTGYRPDDGIPGWGAKYIDPTVAPGRKYGPYVSGEMPMGGDAADPPAFLDAFGNKILYYRFEPGAGEFGGSFDSGHNDGGPPPTSFAAYLTDPNGDLYRLDYVLITPGPDRTWMRVATDEKTDDIANFLFRFPEAPQGNQE